MNTILVFAVIHLGVLAVRAVVDNEWHLLNLGDILDLQFFFPDFPYNAFTAVASVAVVAAVWLYWYLRKN